MLTIHYFQVYWANQMLMMLSSSNFIQIQNNPFLRFFCLKIDISFQLSYLYQYLFFGGGYLAMHFLFEISESSESCLLCSVGYGGSPSSSRNVGHFYWWLFSAEYQSHCNFIWCSLWCISGLLLSRVPSQCPENKALNLREKRDKTLWQN